MTVEFLLEINQLLAKDGLLIANTFSSYKLYDHESTTYNKAYGVFNYIHSRKSGNRIIYISKMNDQNPPHTPLSDQQLSQLERIGVNIDEFESLLTNKPDWDLDARPLTDQYSPANLLNQ